MDSQPPDPKQTEEKRTLIRRLLESRPRSAEAFRALLADEDAFVRQWTIEVMIKLRAPDTAPLIAPLIDDPDSMVRVDALEAIGLLRYYPASARAVERMKQDTESLVRISAAEALGELGVHGDQEITALVTAMEQDHNELVRAYAADSLGRLRATSARTRIKAQTTVERSTRARASMLLALYRLGDDDALHSLLRMLRRVRRLEMEAVILTMLREVISQENQDVIIHALQKIIASKSDFATAHPFDMDLLQGGKGQNPE